MDKQQNANCEQFTEACIYTLKMPNASSTRAVPGQNVLEFA